MDKMCGMVGQTVEDADRIAARASAVSFHSDVERRSYEESDVASDSDSVRSGGSGVGSKVCNRCDAEYRGWGNTCSDCRRSRTGSFLHCHVCGAFFRGFGNKCEDCMEVPRTRPLSYSISSHEALSGGSGDHKVPCVDEDISSPNRTFSYSFLPELSLLLELELELSCDEAQCSQDVTCAPELTFDEEIASSSTSLMHRQPHDASSSELAFDVPRTRGLEIQAGPDRAQQAWRFPVRFPRLPSRLPAGWLPRVRRVQR